jgi:hypothetical protein
VLRPRAHHAPTRVRTLTIGRCPASLNRGQVAPTTMRRTNDESSVLGAESPSDESRDEGSRIAGFAAVHEGIVEILVSDADRAGECEGCGELADVIAVVAVGA